MMILFHVSMMFTKGLVFSPSSWVWTYIKVLPFNIQKIESHPQKIIFWKDTSTRDESREMRIRSLHKW